MLTIFGCVFGASDRRGRAVHHEATFILCILDKMVHLYIFQIFVVVDASAGIASKIVDWLQL
jgi:hypothetical protein